VADICLSAQHAHAIQDSPDGTVHDCLCSVGAARAPAKKFSDHHFFGGNHSDRYIAVGIREICTRNSIISNSKTVRYYGIKHRERDPLREWRPTHFETVRKDRDTCMVKNRVLKNRASKTRASKNRVLKIRAPRDRLPKNRALKNRVLKSLVFKNHSPHKPSLQQSIPEKSNLPKSIP